MLRCSFSPNEAVSAVFGYYVRDQRRLYVAESNFGANVVSPFWSLSSDNAAHELSLLSVRHFKAYFQCVWDEFCDPDKVSLLAVYRNMDDRGLIWFLLNFSLDVKLLSLGR